MHATADNTPELRPQKNSLFDKFYGFETGTEMSTLKEAAPCSGSAVLTS